MFDQPIQNPLIPLTMRASVEMFNQNTPDWPLSEPGENVEQPRTFRTHITFETPYANIPVVQVALTGFDIDNRYASRLEVSMESITPDGFDLLVGTWLDTRVYRVSVSWMALGQ
ncbi:MAG: H-type lectin domain-containing protein [Thiobacillaceae bacterium]